ncbi:MAG: nicotinate (nicotinamide) nucleotide adenylyltransferase [Chitinophagaceae bacterium]
MEIGLYFGSFNPIHVGHLIIASYARQTTSLQQVWLVVSPHNPLKHASGLLNEYHRLHFVRLAIEDDLHLKATDVEFHLPKPSYTVHTLAYLKAKYPHHTFSIIMGSDSFTNLPKWKNYRHILDHHKIYIFMRPGFDVTDDLDGRIEVIEAPLLQISSTEIRSMIKKGLSVRYLVPDKAIKEIEDNRYYRD